MGLGAFGAACWKTWVEHLILLACNGGVPIISIEYRGLKQHQLAGKALRSESVGTELLELRQL